jgi:hypothetical protein
MSSRKIKNTKATFIIFSIALVFKFLITTVFAANISVTVSGQGVSQPEAVANALSEAVKQVTGVYVETNQSFNDLILNTEQSVASKGQEKKIRTMQSMGQNNVRIKSGALIKNYTIDQLEHKNGNYTVVVKVEIEKYKSNISFAETRPRLLIDNLNSENSYLNNQIYSGMLEKMANSNRFAIVDRRNIERFRKELALIRSPDVSTSDKQKLGQIMGTDFILNIEAKGFNCQENEIFIALTRELERTRTCRIDVSYQISELPTSLVVIAGNFTRDSKVNMRAGLSSNSELNQLNLLSENVYNKISNDILESLFPMFVEGFDGNSVIINTVGKTPQIGERFQILKILQEGQIDNVFKFWGARLQPVGEIQLSKYENNKLIGSIVGDEISRDGDFVLKSLLSKDSISTPSGNKERKSVFE